ncbi:MAG: class I SAM-dependent methyltransferase [candidate division KSB1 bacterium]|nr:class I SAM-dependent methyltransferase [candidate division KSB1 bacterium]
MENEVYQLFAEIQATHWWFIARRLILEDILKRSLTSPTPRRLADIGCGTGAMLPTLSQFGEVWGIDNSPEAVALCHHQKLSNVYLDEDPAWRQVQFDVMTFFDVIEHIENETAFLKNYLDQLKPNGLVFITVPAFMFLWTEHDVLNHHCRRYTASRLRQLLQRVDLVPLKLSYFNTWLFPVIAAARVFTRMKRFVEGKVKSNGQITMRTDFERNLPLLNGILRFIFASERFVLRRGSFPFGTSLLSIAKKPDVESLFTPESRFVLQP